MEKKAFVKIPTWNNGNWEYTTFDTKQDLIDLVRSCFKVPGTCEFNETSFMFNEHAQFFNKNGTFTLAPSGSKDWIKYWDTEKEKCRKGVIFKSGNRTWYLPRFYYHWLNFLQLYNKKEKKFTNPDVRDVQYYMALYLTLCELSGKHAVILKRRQVAASFLILAKMYNRHIFEEGYVGKVMASNKNYLIGNNGTWKYLNMYHNFNNKYTAWACDNNPGKDLAWKQSQEIKLPDGRKGTIGTGATITGLTLEADPKGGVGGATDDGFYEEGGVAPEADITYNFMIEAMKEGAETTGLFILSGAVGDLSQCKPLKKFMDDPEGNGFLGIESNLIDEHGTIGTTGLFVAGQWGYHPYIDQYGNSLTDEALVYINKEYERLKKSKSAEDYQIMISQMPRNIKEAFAIRSVSIFPAKYTAAQQRRIETNKYSFEHVEFVRNEDGSVKVVDCNRSPCAYHTSSKTDADKRGCAVIHERPLPNMPWLTYFASIDPVEKGSTKTSDSLAAIYVYKSPVVRNENGKMWVEGDKLVAEWVGRYDDLDDTNEQLSMMVEWYNAFTMCESNKPSFIQHMRVNKRQRYLARKSDMIFDKEVNQTSENIQFQEYGVHMTEQLWSKLLEFTIEFLSKKLDTGTKTNDFGQEEEVVKKYGVERIPFIELIHEMQEYNPKGNWDRLKAFGILCGFLKAQEARFGKLSKTEVPEMDKKTKEEMQKMYQSMMHKSPFRNMGKSTSIGTSTVKTSAFRNMK